MVWCDMVWYDMESCGVCHGYGLQSGMKTRCSVVFYGVMCHCTEVKSCSPSQVDSAYYRGDYPGAESNSRAARGWGIASVVCGCCWIAIVIIYYIAALAAVTSTYG